MASDESENGTYSYDEDKGVYKKYQAVTKSTKGEVDSVLHKKREASPKASSGRPKKQARVSEYKQLRLFSPARSRNSRRTDILRCAQRLSRLHGHRHCGIQRCWLSEICQ
jgi:hypothetical protein